MSDPRHRRQYPDGPRRQMTKAWKQAVKEALARNKAAKRRPEDQAQLAAEIGVHKTAITKMFQAESSALVESICSVLGIPPPMTEVNPDDELEGEVARLTPADRVKVLKFIREFLG